MKRKRAKPKSIKKTSKRGTVRTAYNSGGEAAAFAAGAELDIKQARIRRWIRMWTRREAPATKEPVEPKAKRVINAGLFQEGDTVCITWNTDLVARVVKKGPEQSEIKFANGNVRTIATEHLARFKELN